jgi:hypothetical protein
MMVHSHLMFLSLVLNENLGGGILGGTSCQMGAMIASLLSEKV